jgi:metal-responsive CopG/Arc/MetJ family transcriptional regulator
MSMAIEQDKRTRITISIPEELLIKVDKATLKEYTNRSQWIIHAMLEKLRKSDSFKDNELDVRNRKEEQNELFKDLK